MTQSIQSPQSEVRGRYLVPRCVADILSRGAWQISCLADILSQSPQSEVRGRYLVPRVSNRRSPRCVADISSRRTTTPDPVTYPA
jgi:hypothetical protein